MKKITKDAIKEVKKTHRRFLSIVLIVLLGVGFFAGIKATSPDMQRTLDQYFDDKNVMDIEVLSTLGLTDDDITELKQIEGVKEVEGSYSEDAITTVGEEESVVKVLSIPDSINQLELIEGRLPENETECVVDTRYMEGTGEKIGDTIVLDDSENTQSMLKQKQMTIVGTVHSPLYISMERGSSNLGSGQINYFVYVSKAAFDSDMYTEIYLTCEQTREIDCFSDRYQETVDEVKDKIEAISEERENARYEAIKENTDEEIAKAKEEWNTEKAKADQELADAQAQIDEGLSEIEQQEAKLESSEKTLNNQKNSATKQFEEAEKQIQEAEAKISSNEASLQESKEQYEAIRPGLENQIATLQTTLNELKNNIAALEEQKKQMEEAGQDVTQIQAQIDSLNSQYITLKGQKENLENGLQTAKEKIEQGETLLQTGKAELEAKKEEYQKTKEETEKQFENATSQIEQGKKQIAEGRAELESGQVELDQKKQEAEEELQKGKEKIEEAEQEILDLQKPDWYILDRQTNTGYASYLQDTDRVANIAKVFPAVFFIVAALISLTSMTRMVEEQRTQIGTLKALGYTKLQIAKKYIMYAALATILGGIIGIVIGFRFLPKIIFDMYAMMYTLPDVILEFNWYYFILGLSIAFICTVGATIFSCVKELQETPATLMRPKAPKKGKRVLLEKISFIWSRLKFTQKVTVRNIFRYKKRVLMTIIGILGCTSLIVAGFGLRDAVGQMIPSQYGEVFHYAISIAFQDGTDEQKIQEEVNSLQNTQPITQIMKVNMQSVDILNKNNTQTIQLIVPENTEAIKDYITLQNRTSKENYTLGTDGVVLTEKIAKLLDIKIGDKITLENRDGKTANVKVKGITTNYLMHYAYLSPELYQTLYGETPEYNNLLINTSSMDDQTEDSLGKQILQNNNVSSVTFTANTKGIFEDVMENMTFVVWILIISAALLAFVVLYNLSNVNISERIRELATIKVLGFYDKEVYKYVARETIILTIIGIALGLVAGYVLNMFIIKTCELDILMFDPRIKPMTYIYGIALTALFTGIVNIVTYFSLKKISMIDSLKSVE